MLKNSLLHGSQTVKVDILTLKDLEYWKKKLAGNSDTTMQSLGSESIAAMTPEENQKRYLILTETTEFDRVFYPIPLLMENEPSAERLIKTIDRMRSDIDSMRASNGFWMTNSSMGNTSLQSNSDLQNWSGASFYTMPEQENEALLKENEDLKSQISEMEMSMWGESDFDALFKSSEQIEMEMLRYKQEQQEVIDALKKEIREKEEKILALDDQISSMKSTKTSGFAS